MHAYGAAFDNPDLLVACVIGDGEAETGPLAASWHSNKFLDPVGDGVVLPILHLNGYKIANPTVLARIPEPELLDLMRGYGYQPYVLEAGLDDDHLEVHARMASTMDEILDRIAEIKRVARGGENTDRPQWPMLVFRTPKGWTGPAGGGRRAGRGHVPGAPGAAGRACGRTPSTWPSWSSGCARTGRRSCSTTPAGCGRRSRAIAPTGQRRMSDNPHANGGMLLRDLRLPDFRDYAVEVAEPGTVAGRVDQGARHLAAGRDPAQPDDVPADGPGRDRLQPADPGVRGDRPGLRAPSACPATTTWRRAGGSWRCCRSTCARAGWRATCSPAGTALFNCYEAFIHIVDSMFNQHAKWLESTSDIPWRRPVASLNYLLSSHVWRQDHNGFSHQDPGFIDHVVNKKAAVVRVYLPPDANTLLSTYDHCLRSRNYVNVVVAGKQPAAALPGHGGGGRALHPRRRHLGVGVQ